MVRTHHLAGQRLFECYLLARRGDAIDPPSAEHLTDCNACRAAYAELTAFMEGMRLHAAAETDAVFTPERLRAQQQRIATRLEHVGRPARVISFPGTVGGRDLTVSATRIAPRWVAAAAAAGLFLGVALGASYEWERRVRTPHRLVATGRPAARPTRLSPVGTRGNTPASVADDEAFLSDLEAALQRPHTRELAPFDALTPHVRDVNVPIR